MRLVINLTKNETTFLQDLLFCKSQEFNNPVYRDLYDKIGMAYQKAKRKQAIKNAAE